MREGTVLEITNAIAAYCQCYDDRDREGLRSVLHPDCAIDLVGGRFDGQSFRGREAVVDWLAGTWPVTPPCLHLTGNIRLALSGAEVQGTTDYLFLVQREGRFEVAGRGRYLDTLAEVDGRWLLRRRTVFQPA